jgi:hypothetical protein
LEAVVVPVPLVKGDELGCSEASNWLSTANALLGKELGKTLRAIRFLVTRSELLPHQHLVASVTGEALTMPRCVLVGYSSLVDHAIAFHASLSVLLLIARYADSLLVTWYEGLDANWLPTDLATEAFLVKRLALELVLFHTSAKDVGTSVASLCEVVVVAVRAEGLVIPGGEWLVDKRDLAIVTVEAFLVPMLVLVRQILEIGADDLLAFLASVGKQRFVAFDAERLLVA